MELVKWRAIIDENTCNECLELDGMFFEKGKKQPPLHGIDERHKRGCRCYLIGVTEQVEKLREKQEGKNDGEERS